MANHIRDDLSGFYNAAVFTNTNVKDVPAPSNSSEQKHSHPKGIIRLVIYRYAVAESRGQAGRPKAVRCLGNRR